MWQETKPIFLSSTGPPRDEFSWILIGNGTHKVEELFWASQEKNYLQNATMKQHQILKVEELFFCLLSENYLQKYVPREQNQTLPECSSLYRYIFL